MPHTQADISFWDKYNVFVQETQPIKQVGHVQSITGLQINSFGPHARIGELCQIVFEKQNKTVLAEVVGLNDSTVQLAPYESVEGIQVGFPVVGLQKTARLPVSHNLLGRVIDAQGIPIDGKGPIGSAVHYSVFNNPPEVLQRKAITQQMETGIRVIDSLLPVGKGQRMGIFSSSGVGKSVLIGMIARNTTADVNVIGLVGERSREVKEFIDTELGEEGLQRSVIVVAASNSPAIARLRAAYMATTIAEYFRDEDNHVMLLLDSVTRLARAQREIGLSLGESPAARGFPPSMDALLPQLLERCGTGIQGSITGFYTILVEGDDMDEPVTDAVRGILDGHIMLSRKLAAQRHYPAVDVLTSISRLETKITSKEHQDAMSKIRKLMADYSEAEDLINAGVYEAGSNAAIDEAIQMRPVINELLCQGIEEHSDLSTTLSRLFALTNNNNTTGK